MTPPLHCPRCDWRPPAGALRLMDFCGRCVTLTVLVGGRRLGAGGGR